MGTPTITGLTLFNSTANQIQSIRAEIDTGLYQLSIPGEQTSSNFGLNIFGKKFFFIIEGIYSGTEAQIASFITEVLGYVDQSAYSGGGTEDKTLTTRFGHTYTIRPANFNYEDNVSAIGEIRYQLVVERGTGY